MSIGELTSSGAIPTLEAMMRFSAQRQKLLASNVANFSTSDYRPLDVSPRKFQEALRDAVEDRRKKYGEQQGRLDFGGTKEAEFHADGSIELHPETPSDNILFHDRNNRDLERTMQDMVENLAMYRVSSELYRGRMEILKSAISERV